MLEIGVEWIRRLSCVCGCERDRESVHVSHIQTNIGEKLDPEIRSFVSARETYEGTQDISRERECV